MKIISIKSLAVMLFTFYGVAGAQNESHEGISFFNGTLKEEAITKLS